MTTPQKHELGCEHGRGVGIPCPHCMGINQPTKQEHEPQGNGITEMFSVLEHEGLSPKYIEVDESGFSRWIEFHTKYQTCWIEWYKNVSTLRVSDMWGVRIPFHRIKVSACSPANKKCLTFVNEDVTKNFGLADSDVELTLEKLDWQNL